MLETAAGRHRQDDSFEGLDSLVVCPFTSDTTEAPFFRLPVEPNPGTVFAPHVA